MPAHITKMGIGTQRQQRQLPVQHEQHDGNADQRQGRGQQSFEPIHENPLYVFGIAGTRGHDFAGRPILEITQRQALQRAEHLTAQCMHGLLLEHIVEVNPHRTHQVP